MFTTPAHGHLHLLKVDKNSAKDGYITQGPCRRKMAHLNGATEGA